MKKWIVTYLILMSAATVYSQVPFFEHYRLLKREQVQVNVVFQDRSGFIWCGTNQGLFRLDGINITHYEQKDSLPDNHVTAIGQDSLGRIWTGFRNGKLAYFENGKIVKFNPQEGTSTHEISDILFDREGNLWFSTLDDGLYYFKNKRLYRVDEEEGMPDLFVYDLMEDPRGNIWAGTDGGVAICRLKDSQVQIRVLDHRQGLTDNIVKKILIDKNNMIWLGTEDAGLVSYNPSTGKTMPLVKEGWKFGSLTDFVILDDQLWITSAQKGLVVYNTATRQQKSFHSAGSIDLSAANSVISDFEGNIWVGSKSGLIRTLGDQVDYVDSFYPFKNTNVLALTVDQDNNLWYSTGEGLFKQKLDTSGDQNIQRPLLNSRFQKYIAISLYTDDEGYVWAGLYGEGLLRIEPETGHIDYFQKQLSNGNVLNITGNGDTIWLATLGGATRIVQNEDGLSFQNFGRAEGLVSDYIYQVFIDSQNRVWFATDGKGVGMLDQEGFHHFESGLASKVVYGFAEDRNHTIWANLQGEGLFSFNGRTFEPMKTETPLREKNINCVSSDKLGNLVIMHDLGIDIYDARRKKVRYYGDEVGIQDKRPNLNALATDATGRVYVGTDKGIVRYANLSLNLPPAPRPLITGMKVLDRKISLAGNLKFDHDENSVVIQYIGFWFQNPANLNFEYRLENYDRDWIRSHDRAATYSSLQPGDYVFKVRSSDTEDFTDAPEVNIAFTIDPPFWKTGWFIVLAVIASIASGVAFISYRERKLISDNRILEEKVLERTMEIQKQAEEIQAQNEEIQSQAEEIQGINDNLEMIVLARTQELEKKNKASEEAAFIIAHELRAPVASVLGLVNLISKTKLPREARDIVDHMQCSGEKLDNVVRNITKAIERGDR
ncbi:two-component regulator propeller domain-containing protein [Chryseolinea sp. T2]|uniref:two-component regulator propeller domain-containing protein n=1 Tax=Chryseolinea sp. T2 TaxID=3129255 RepID=UPI003077DB76